MELRYRPIPYPELSKAELYDLLRLRAEVFVVEQDCPYQDLDGKDQACIHLCGYSNDGQLAAYTRLVPKGISYPDYASIGRVITATFARGKGIGRPLMEASIYHLTAAFGQVPIKISAQAHLQDFYASVGFTGTGDIYDEDGIPHRAMVLERPTP